MPVSLPRSVPEPSVLAANPAAQHTTDLLRLMQQPGNLEVRDRLYHLRVYRNTFLGSALVDLFSATFDTSREQAVRMGQRLLALELISHVTGEHDFKDRPLFYVFGSGRDATGQADLSVNSVRQLMPELRSTHGLQPGVRRRLFVDYPGCFYGRELVDWLCRHTKLSRAEGLAAGQAMLQGNLIRHVLDEQSFHDNSHLYCFV